MRAAIYARVSTAHGGQNPEMQLRELREYCERRGWDVAGEYVDVGISGSKKRFDLANYAGAQHVLYDERRLAGNVVAEVAHQHTRVEVIGGARAGKDDHRQLSPPVELLG